MKIRKALKKDYNALHSLEAEWFNEGISPGSVRNTMVEFIKDMENSTVFVAEENNELLAYMVCKIRKAEEDNNVHKIKKGEDYADIDSIYVKKNYRNKGIGSELVNQCMKELKKHGYKKIILSADSKELNKLVRFYEKHGFKVLFTRMMHELK